MKRRKSKTTTPQIRLVGRDAPVRVAVAVAGLASGAALAAPGDLDPSFGKVGRLTGIATPGVSTLQSIDVRDDESVIFGGGGEYDYYGSYVDEFVAGVLPDGSPDAGLAVPGIEASAIFDTALQSDGKLVGVGVSHLPDGKRKLLVFRALPNGAPDLAFGLSGKTIISDGGTGREAGYSVAIDGDGRIVVAGERSNRTLVARLLPNGTLDASFGTGGIYIGPETGGSTVRIALAPANGYRLIATVPAGGMGWDCQVSALTATGAADATFGTGGTASPTATLSGGRFCSSISVLADGRIMVGGQDNGVAFVSRLLANGALDPAFAAPAVVDRLGGVSALGVGASGKVVVAGTDRVGFLGAQVLRLQSTGALDTTFGRAGVTSVDPEIRHRQSSWISDLKVGTGDSVFLGGNTYSWWAGNGGFVAKLLGDSGGGSPGVFSIQQSRILATEAGGSAVMTVRRTGGSAGSVGVSYSTKTFPWLEPGGATYSPGEQAVPGEDYTAATGQLTWADGDTSDREIVVPISTDAVDELPEWFAVVLETPEGGAGLGLHGTEVEIAGKSYPHGDFTILVGTPAVREGVTADFFVNRNYYTEGEVSVTVRVAAGTSATPGEDFRSSATGWQDVVLTWGDGEMGGKYVPVYTVVDTVADDAESVQLELASPTGGAMLGSVSRATVIINSSPPPPEPAPPKSRSGGGTFGAFGAILLGLAGALRRRRLQQ
jgi:uncharacterized delta-60 repeat protein/MYXO-CTERM domain-containing protein